MRADPLERLVRQIEPAPLALDLRQHPDAVLGVVEAGIAVVAPVGLIKRPLAGMAEGRVADVVAEGDGLREVLVEPEGLGDSARDLRDLEGVAEARAKVVLARRDEDLRLVREAPERAAEVDDPVAVALEVGAHRIGLGRPRPAA